MGAHCVCDGTLGLPIWNVIMHPTPSEAGSPPQTPLGTMVPKLYSRCGFQNAGLLRGRSLCARAIRPVAPLPATFLLHPGVETEGHSPAFGPAWVSPTSPPTDLLSTIKQKLKFLNLSSSVASSQANSYLIWVIKSLEPLLTLQWISGTSFLKQHLNCWLALAGHQLQSRLQPSPPGGTHKLD